MSWIRAMTEFYYGAASGDQIIYKVAFSRRSGQLALLYLRSGEEYSAYRYVRILPRRWTYLTRRLAEINWVKLSNFERATNGVPIVVIPSKSGRNKLTFTALNAYGEVMLQETIKLMSFSFGKIIKRT